MHTGEGFLVRLGVGVGGRAAESLARMGVEPWKYSGLPSLVARKDTRGCGFVADLEEAGESWQVALTLCNT